MNSKSLIILIALNVGHLFADYTWLSRPYMLKAKHFGYPLRPIAIHALVHAMMVWVILMPFMYPSHLLLVIVIFEFITHFLIDVWKGRMNKWFPVFQDTASYYHWTLFGIDQFLHQLVLIIITYFVCQ